MPSENKSKRTKRSGLQGTSFQWTEPVPWPDPVEGHQLLSTLAETFCRCLVLPAGAADAMALWITYTWTFDVFDVSPILAVTSPVKRCGKTQTVILLQALAKRSLAASSITPAALFRFVEREQPTLIVDEADRFLLRSEDLQGILNAGHTKMTARVIRTVGDNFEPRSFSTWCPKAIALIGKLPDTLQDRSIEIRMRRKLEGEQVAHLRSDRISEEVEDLRCQAARWVMDNCTVVATADPCMPKDLNDRASDNWRPLVAIADAAGGDWPERARRAAVEITEGGNGGEDLSLLLLSDIHQIFGERDVDRLPTADLVGDLLKDGDRPWSEWWPGREPREIAKLLKPFGIGSKKLRLGAATAQGYLSNDFRDAFERYLPLGAEQVEHPEQPRDSAESDCGFENTHPSDDGSDLAQVLG